LEVTLGLVVERLIIIFGHDYLKFGHDFLFLNTFPLVADFRKFAVREKLGDLLLLEYFINEMTIHHKSLKLLQQVLVIFTLVVCAVSQD